MTISTTPSEKSYAGDGVSTQFAIPFPFETAADIKVVRTEDATGSITQLTTGWSVTGGNGSTGTLTLTSALPSGYTLTIIDDPEIKQSIDYVSNDAFPAETHERGLDRNVRMIKRVHQQVLRCLRTQDGDPVNDDDMVLPNVVNRANRLLAFDSSGKPEAAAAIDVPINALTQSIIAALLYPRTAAEIAAGVTPTSYAYAPGDFRRYGAVSGGSVDNSDAWADMLAQAEQVDGAPAYVPQGVWLVNTGYAANTRPIKLHGDGLETTIITTTEDITPLTLNFNASHSDIRDLTLTGPGTSPSDNPGILLNNCNGVTFKRIKVHAFKYGVYFEKGINSCYLCSMYDCQIISNKLVNIYCEGDTNALYLSNCTLGGGPVQTGLYIRDSNNLTVLGGDAEGCAVCVFDLDSTSGTSQSSHYICGFHFEGNTSSAGDVRIGNTAAVAGVTLVGCLYAPGMGNDCAVNAIRGDGLSIIGGDLHSGYTGVPFRRIGASFGRYTIAGVGQWDNETSYQKIAGALVSPNVTVAYSASMTIDAALGNRFEIVASDTSPFTINAPSNPSDGQEITVWVANSSGGTLGTITWDSAFHLAGSFTAPATGHNRSITFRYRSASSTWYEVARTAADVAN